MKKYIAVLTAVVALALPGIALASPANNEAQCGTDAASGAFANVNGNFGGLGEREPPGANGYQTGLNNSAVCGNR